MRKALLLVLLAALLPACSSSTGPVVSAPPSPSLTPSVQPTTPSAEPTPEGIRVPRLRNLRLAHAKCLLHSLNLRTRVMREVSAKPEGTVLAQSIDPGTFVRPRRLVKLTIAGSLLTGEPPNPWGFNFGCCHLIYQPPKDFCSFVRCISSFWGSSGYVIQCVDGEFSKSGGRSGSCSYHGGNSRAYYAP